MPESRATDSEAALSAAAGNGAGPPLSCRAPLLLRRASLTLVSRRWHEAFYTEPSLWRTFRLAPSRIEGMGAAALHAKLALLRRVAALVEEMEVRDSTETDNRRLTRWNLVGGNGSPPLTSFLTLLVPGQLLALSIECAAYMLPAALWPPGQFTQLQSLNLTTAHMADNPAAYLAHLPQLCDLSLKGAMLGGGTVEAAAHCSRLTSLRLAAYLLASTPQQLQQLSRLASLVHLSLLEDDIWYGRLEQAAVQQARLRGPMRPPPPAAFPALQTYSLSSIYRPVQVSRA